MAEDIVQDCFLKTWLRREEMKDIANFGAWLHVMAANLTYNALRKTKASNLREERYHYDNPVFTSNESILLEKECFFIIIRYLKMLASLVQWNCNNSFLHRKFFIV